MPTSNPCEPILTYLRDHLPRYPFQQSLDADFVSELVADFPGVSILGELKNLRWYYDNDPVGRVANVRVAIRRWLDNATQRRRPAERRRTRAPAKRTKSA